MSEILNKLRKRRGAEVDVEEDKFFLRDVTLGELRRVDAVPNEFKTGFIVGCKLCADSVGTPEFPKQDGESDEAWAKRVTEEIEDVPTAKISAIASWSSKMPKTADVVKN